MTYEKGCLRKLREKILEIRTAKDAPFEDRFTKAPAETQGQGSPFKRLIAPSLIGSNSWLRDQERADWQNVDLWLAHWSARLIHSAVQVGVPLYVHSAWRTDAEQNALVAQGRSKTKPPRAAHCQGMAVDIVHSRYHWDLTKDEWFWLGYLGQNIAFEMNKKLPKEDRCELQWGGDWKFYDPAHWEVIGWQDNLQRFPQPTGDKYEPVRRTVTENTKLARQFERFKGRRIPPAPDYPLFPF